MAGRAALRLCALLVPGLVVLSVGLSASAAPPRPDSTGRSSSATCVSSLCGPLVFSGTGTATTTSTIHNPDGSTSSFTYTDTFSWHVYYDVPFGGKRHYQRGWNVIGVQADPAESSFTGTSTESCSAPPNGSCTVGGGAPSCRGNFENTAGIPLELLVFSPPSNGSWKLATPAHQASQRTSGNCSQVARALDDTCDPLWNGPFPGQGENTPVTARFSLQPKLVLWKRNASAPKPIPVSASKSWSCTSSNGTSTDKGSIEWHGTVKAQSCSDDAMGIPSARLTAARSVRPAVVPLRDLAPEAKTPGLPELPRWLKPDCVVYNLEKATVEKDKHGRSIYRPAHITWKCKVKVSFSYVTRGVVPCETPDLVTVYIRGHLKPNGLPVYEVFWNGPVVGTGKNVWTGLDKAAKELKHILENFIPVG